MGTGKHASNSSNRTHGEHHSPTCKPVRKQQTTCPSISVSSPPQLARTSFPKSCTLVLKADCVHKSRCGKQQRESWLSTYCVPRTVWAPGMQQWNAHSREADSVGWLTSRYKTILVYYPITFSNSPFCLSPNSLFLFSFLLWFRAPWLGRFFTYTYEREALSSILAILWASSRNQNRKAILSTSSFKASSRKSNSLGGRGWIN